jgi:hypothetical protein
MLYHYNSGRLNNQVHSLWFAFSASKIYGRTLVIPKVDIIGSDRKYAACGVTFSCVQVFCTCVFCSFILYKVEAVRYRLVWSI